MNCCLRPSAIASATCPSLLPWKGFSRCGDVQHFPDALQDVVHLVFHDDVIGPCGPECFPEHPPVEVVNFLPKVEGEFQVD
eukprot:6986107-Heterocapsa_arctica.AAC.1